MKSDFVNKEDSGWREALIGPNATVQQVIGNLERTGFQIVIVVDEKGELIGTITDGDVRRGMLRGLSLESPITSIIHCEALVVPKNFDRTMAHNMMQINRVHQLPIVDEHRHVIGLHLWESLYAPIERNNMMVIMAGGLGTRLRPHTQNCPKPMLPVNGKPMLEHILKKAAKSGFRRFIITVCHLGHMIEEYFGDGSSWGVEIEYLCEDSPLGTVGALSLLKHPLDKPFIVSNGDILTDISYGDLLDYHIHHSAIATMSVRLYEMQNPFGVVQLSGIDIRGFEEKPITKSYINSGVYALDPNATEMLVPGEACDMPELFNRLRLDGQRTIAYPIHEPWLDVGRPDDLELAKKTVVDGKLNFARGEEVCD